VLLEEKSGFGACPQFDRLLLLCLMQAIHSHSFGFLNCPCLLRFTKKNRFVVDFTCLGIVLVSLQSCKVNENVEAMYAVREKMYE